jgi:DNA helicase-2/ATP-dependent DNA helicase PcrA
MKTAIYENKTIQIKQMRREDFQSIYEAGKNGKLSCPVCGEKVRFYLGIQELPHFYHLSKKNPPCQDPIDMNTENARDKVEYIERNGFKLPVSRTITADEHVTEFKQARLVQDVPNFAGKTLTSKTTAFPYIQLLNKHHIMLDQKQMEAVTKTDGSLLVVAGAGSGKTRVLTTRTAYMLHEKKVDPRVMMLVTFTAKAANEMKNRLQQYPGIENSQIQRLATGTFHSLFYRILAFHDREKWSSHKLLKRDWQKEQIVKEGGKELNLDDKEFAYDLALQQIGFWKNSLVMPNEVEPTSKWEEQTAFLYKFYEQKKNEHEWFDFDDMLLGCYQLFQAQPAVLESYQNRFQYFLIDEFQDINKVQYELIKLLSAKSKNICAVGDDDQSIYSFRGSDPKYLLQFEKDFPNGQIVILNENYRSTHEIVSTANRVIEKNKKRRPKKMNAQLSTKAFPVMFFPYDEEEEATMIVTDIQGKIENGFQPGDFAVLFRTNSGSRAIFERLTNSSIPFRIDQDIEPFYERFIVKGMISFLRLALNEDDSIAIQSILPALFVKQHVLQDIKANSILNDCSFLECLSQIKTGFAFQERKLKRLVSVVRSLRSLSPAAAMEMVEKELGYGDFIKKRGGEGNKLDKGSDDIRDLKVAAKRFSTIPEFLEHVDHMTAMNKEIKRLNMERENTVTLSTIHRAKGLEYKVVYIIGTVDGSIPHDYALDSYRNGDFAPIEEERRLLYVAMTRAIEQLFISVPSNRRGKKVYPSRFLSPIK